LDQGELVMKKLITILVALYISSCCGYESFDIRYEVAGGTFDADIRYNTRGKGLPVFIDVYDASLPWEYSYTAKLYYNIDDEIYEDFNAEATAVKTTDDSSLITIKLFVDDKFVDEDFTSAPYGRVRVVHTISSEDRY